MSQLTAQIDQVAEALDRMGHRAIAAVLDNVSEELAEREGCAENQDDDESVATASFPTLQQQSNPSELLTGSANRLLEATKQYGAKSCRIEGQAVELVLDRGEVETTAALEFCSRDEAGKPQLRLTFRCGGDKMVRWASLDRFDADTLTTATQHVFGTGTNYGANVVTAGLELPELTQQQLAENWMRDLFGGSGGSMTDKDLKAAMKRFHKMYGKEAIERAFKSLKTEKYISKKGKGWKWDPNFPVARAAPGLQVHRAVDRLIDAIAQTAAGRLMLAKISGEPYQRALDRIKSLEERGVDVEKHTLMRLSKTNNIDKIEGLYQAAMHVGLGRVASEAKKKFRQLTGKNPMQW